MPTPFDALNCINLAETAAMACINGDAWLGSTSNVATVHQKIRRTTDDLFELYLKSELPAIGILVEQGGADDRFTLGEFEEVIRLGFDIWVIDGDLDAADQTAKTIMARLRRLMRLQAFSLTVNSESNQLDTFLANGTIDNEEFDFEYFDTSGNWLVHGVTYSLLTILSTE